MALLFLKNFTSGSYFTCRLLETPEMHCEKQWHCPNLEMKEMTESVMVLACDTEGTLASESRGSSSRPRSLSLSHLPKFCISPFSSLDCFSLCAKKEQGLTWINFTISSNSRISTTSVVSRTSTINIVQFSLSVMSDSLWPHGLQHTRPPCPSPTSNSCPLSRWRHSTISSSVIPFSSRLQSFPTSRSFKMSQFFTSGGQSIEVSASTSVLPVDIQDWFPLGWTSWISLHSKGLLKVFSSTTVQKHQFFSTQLSV